MKKILLAAALTAATTTAAHASEVEWNFGFGTSDGKPRTEFHFGYNSQSFVTDSDLDGELSVGDTIVSAGGYGAMGFEAFPTPLTGNTTNPTGEEYGHINANSVGFFSPLTPYPSNYANGYVFTFAFNNLMGEWDGTDFSYSSGTIKFGYVMNPSDSTDMSQFNSLFDVDLQSGGRQLINGEAKQVFNGEVIEGSLANGAGAGFTLTQNGTTDSLTNWLLGDKRVLFSTNQTVSGGLPGATQPSSGAGITFNAAGDTTLIAANHSGRFSLNVPEPSTIAIFGLSLLGLAGVSRKRKA